jgi:hypothetical protein
MDYILRLLIDLVIRASCHRVIGQCFNGSNDVDYLGAGLRFDTVLTFSCFTLVFGRERTGEILHATQPEEIEVHSHKVVVGSVQPRSVRIERVPGNFPG